MNAEPVPENLSQSARLEAVAAILARGFMRLQPGPLARIRSAVERSEDSAQSASISLDSGGEQSVYASVNQE